MMVIRPVEPGDLPGLLKLAAETGGGLTSLPVDEATLAARIARSQQTWRGELPKSEQGYVFVLEESESGTVVGICAIEVAVGLNDPWYNYRVGTQVHASKELNVYQALPTLFLSNDHTGSSELCTCSSTRSGAKRAMAICCRNRASYLWPLFASASMRRWSPRCAG
jgi:arginine N-succinyltransferase